MRCTLAAITALMGVAQAVSVQVVSVGRNPVSNATGLKFWPENIKAELGSMVQFQFLVGNHTVTQSDFDNPCKPINEVNPNIKGIFSSFQPAAASASKNEIPVFTIMVNDTKPLWFFCSQGPHCEKGMAMVINENTSANSSRSLENYKSIAAGATPAESPTEESSVSGSTPAGASETGKTAGASVASVSSSLLLALGAVFMLL